MTEPLRVTKREKFHTDWWCTVCRGRCWEGQPVLRVYVTGKPTARVCEACGRAIAAGLALLEAKAAEDG